MDAFITLVIGIVALVMGFMAGGAVVEVSIQKDCHKLGQFRIDDHVYTCTPR